MLGAFKNPHKNAVVTWDDFMSLKRKSTATGGRLPMHNSQVAASSAGDAAISTFARGGSRHNERAGSSLRLESRAFMLRLLACFSVIHLGCNSLGAWPSCCVSLSTNTITTMPGLLHAW